MDFFINHWGEILTIVVIAAGAGIFTWRFFHMPTAERQEQIKAWLLQAVLWAEKEYGAGTGKLKLSAVYREFCTQLPWLAKVVSFEVFSAYVDEALKTMKEILASNAAIAAIVSGKAGMDDD